MIYYRCKCGKNEHWSSMGVAPCDFCHACNSTPASGPNGHRDTPTPHKIGRTKVKADEGEAYLVRCIYCFKRLSAIKEKNEPFEMLAEDSE
jgi:hypothetical protein